jgi:endonuclease/exonuclease/phosphatase family metal-dependent hydrolase
VLLKGCGGTATATTLTRQPVITIATWNVQNLFLPGGDGPRTPEAYRTKLDGLAATVRDAGVEAVAVQEVGDATAFEDLRATLGADWTGILSTQPDVRRGIRVGVLSRLPAVRRSDDVRLREGLPPLYTDDTRHVVTRMSRGALTVAVTAPSGTVVQLVTCHLKSKLVSYPGGRFDTGDEAERARFVAYGLFQRASEAATVRGVADRLLAGQGQQRPVVVLGDLNDEPQAATTQLLLGPVGSEFGTPAADRPDKGDGHRLFNPCPLLPEGERFTRVFGARHELIDHILVSAALRTAVTGMRTVHGAPLPDLGVVPTTTVAAPFSDHAMLVATLDI